MVDTAYDRLKAQIGVQRDTQYISRRARSVALDETTFNRLGSCARPIYLGNPSSGVTQAADGSVVDEWGVTWRSAGPGHHYNPVGNPLRSADKEDLESYPWPDPDDPGWTRGLREAAGRASAEGHFAVALSLPSAVVHLSQYLRGYEEYLMDLVIDPGFAARLMERVADVYVRIVTNAMDVVGDQVDVVLFGDDIAFQDRPMVRPDVYRELIKPHHRRIIEAIKGRSAAAVLYHCCGAVTDLIPDFIDIGVDALNPVQVSAVGIGDTVRLKREFGRDLTFWGGIDTHHVLPRGTPADVRDEVRRRIEDLATGGGYVVAAVHNIQDDVPPENILALADAVREFAG
jgi:uroporphyrinogen decarboxylase